MFIKDSFIVIIIASIFFSNNLLTTIKAALINILYLKMTISNVKGVN